MDALGRTHPAAQRARLADVTPDGAAIRIREESEPDGVAADVHPRHRPAIARLRTSRRLSGCVAGDLRDGILDADQGVYGSRRR